MSAKERCQQCCREACTVENVKGKLPISWWLPKYSWRWLQCDIIAGLTVGLTVIPQGLAYAKVADLEPQYGLYSAFMGCFIYCFLGTSKDITLGPTAIMSLMTYTFANCASCTIFKNQEAQLHGNAVFAVILTLMCGAVQLALGVFRLGVIVEFISFPVISGFTSAAAIIIAFGQVKHLLGLSVARNPFIFAVIADIISHIKETKIWDLVLGAISIVLLLLLKQLKSIKWGDEDSATRSQKVARKFLWLMGTGRNAVVVISGALIAWAMMSKRVEDDEGKEPLTLTGQLHPGLPPFKVPDFSVTSPNGTVLYTTTDIFKNIGIGFAVVPLIGLVETIAIGKAFARQNNYIIDANQELIAIGASNILGSFVSSYPVTGSFSRTAVNSQSGVKTPAGGIFTGSLILLALGVLTRWFYYIPSAALAAVIISAVLPMCDFTVLLQFWRIKKLDIIPWAATFIPSFILGIEYGIVIGIAISTLILLYPLARPEIEVAYEDVMIIKVEHGLSYPGIEFVKERVLTLSDKGDYRGPVVLDLHHISTADYSTVQGIKELKEDFKKMGEILVLCKLRANVAAVFRKAEIADLPITSSYEEAYQYIKDNTNKEELDARRTLLPGHHDNSANLSINVSA